MWYCDRDRKLRDRLWVSAAEALNHALEEELVSAVSVVKLAWFPSQLDGLGDGRQGVCDAANLDSMVKVVATCLDPSSKCSCNKVAFNVRDVWSKERTKIPVLVQY